MDKNSIAWLVVRVLGLISLGVAFYKLYMFILNLVGVFVTSTQQEISSNGTLYLVNLNWDPFIGFLFFFGVSVYFLKFGSTIHKLLIKEGGK